MIHVEFSDKLDFMCRIKPNNQTLRTVQYFSRGPALPRLMQKLFCVILTSP